MPDYSKTIIYKIQHQDKPELVYVGHTTNFTKRKHEHKRVCNSVNDKKHKLKIYQIIRENGGWEEFKMIELKEFSCENKKEACLEEDKIMLELKSNLNTYRSKEFNREEWYNFNIDKLTEQKSKYYKENKEHLSKLSNLYREKNKEYLAKINKEWREINKEEIKIKSNEYYENNKEK